MRDYLLSKELSYKLQGKLFLSKKQKKKSYSVFKQDSDGLPNEKISRIDKKLNTNRLSMTFKTKPCASEKQQGSKDPFLTFIRSAKKTPDR